MNALASSLSFSNSSMETFLIKGLLGEGVLKDQMKTNSGRGSGLSLCSLYEKNCLGFQTVNSVPSNKLLGSCLKFY